MNSDTIPVTGGEQYELSLHIGGEMPVPLGHGGRIRAHYPGSSADPVAVWVNPGNFNNSGMIFSQPFTPPTNANSIQFSYEVTMDKGRLAFSEAALSHLNPAYTITRKTYALGGQTIATRISGDQEGESDGLYYIHSDHLGSTSIMSYGQGHGSDSGNKVPDSTARYLPFGDWRVEPAHDLTDQGFTGQKHNMDLGLYYYNARFYLPGIGRFASADTIVPDPKNPQQFNRYTYVLNNPLRFTDPTGHSCTNPANTEEATACQQLENDILSWTILIEISFQVEGDAICPVGSLQSCSSISHGTVYDSQTLVTHNHFRALGPGATISSILLYRADGSQLGSGGSLSIVSYETSHGAALETLKFKFGENVFAGINSPDFASYGDYMKMGSEVAQINWDGQIGTSYIQWVTLERMGRRPDRNNRLGSVQVAYAHRYGELNNPLNHGASGGGVFTREGVHIGNNWAFMDHGNLWWQYFYVPRSIIAINPF